MDGDLKLFSLLFVIHRYPRELFGHFVEFVKSFMVMSGIVRFTCTAEKSLKSADAGRIHFHMTSLFKGPLRSNGIFVQTTSSVTCHALANLCRWHELAPSVNVGTNWHRRSTDIIAHVQKGQKRAFFFEIF